MSRGPVPIVGFVSRMFVPKRRRQIFAVGAAATLAALALLLGALRAAAVDQQSPECASCTIQIELVQRFGTASGPGALPGEPSTVLLDSDQRFWLLFYGRSMPLLFNSDGDFLGEIGRRGGGPGEFQHPEFSVLLPGDSVLIVDPVTKRGTIFDRELRPVRSITLDTGQLFSLEGTFWPKKLIISSVFRTPEGIGLPLHSLEPEGDRAFNRASFGLEEEIRRSQDLRLLEAHVAASPAGTLWAVDRRRYRMSEWTPEGELLRVIERRPDWFAGVSDGRHPRGRRNEPPPVMVAGATIDQQERIWIYTLVPAATWRDAWDEVPETTFSGETSMAIRPDPDKLYHTMVEVIDLRTQRLITSQLIEKRIHRIVHGSGMVTTYRDDEAGVPVVTILRMSLAERP